MTAIHRMGPVDIQHFDVVGTSPLPTNTIQSGDAVANVGDKAVPANAFTWTTDLSTTQTNFAAAFLGISESRSLPESDIRGMRVAVNMDGTYEADATSATYTVGQYIGLAKDTGNNLLSSKVEGCTTKARAIGVVLEAGVALTRVKFRLINTAIKR